MLTSRDNVIPPLMRENMGIFVCPVCGGGIKLISGRALIKCSKCNQIFKCESGIPLLFWLNEWGSKDDVTKIVKSFYEKTPFPNYENIDSIWTLRNKAREGIFTRLLDEQIPHDAKFLEVGCGTGQLSNFLGSAWRRRGFATDICLNSLKLGQKFKKKAKIKNTAFFQMNLFRPIFKPESFDFVICNGVLHHTSDPFWGFKTISKLVKSGGYIIVGLYNKYGRIPTDIRRLIFQLSGGRFKFLDPILRGESLSDTKKNTWFMDQYKNPHESKHTMGEVLGWFDQTNIEFINSIPKSSSSISFSQEEEVFSPNPRGTALDHFLVQLGMLFSGGAEGGFFVMIGQKR